MGRPRSAAVACALDAYTRRLSAGVGHHEALAAAKVSVGADGWTPAVAASVSRAIKPLRPADVRRGGDHRDWITRRVAAVLMDARHQLRSVSQARRDAHNRYAPDAAAVALAADARRALTRPGRPPGSHRRHQLDTMTAPADCGTQMARWSDDNWQDVAPEIRQTAYAEVAVLASLDALDHWGREDDHSAAKRRRSLMTRAKRVLRIDAAPTGPLPTLRWGNPNRWSNPRRPERLPVVEHRLQAAAEVDPEVAAALDDPHLLPAVHRSHSSGNPSHRAMALIQ